MAAPNLLGGSPRRRRVPPGTAETKGTCRGKHSLSILKHPEGDRVFSPRAKRVPSPWVLAYAPALGAACLPPLWSVRPLVARPPVAVPRVHSAEASALINKIRVHSRNSRESLFSLVPLLFNNLVIPAICLKTFVSWRLCCSIVFCVSAFGIYSCQSAKFADHLFPLFLEHRLCRCRGRNFQFMFR